MRTCRTAGANTERVSEERTSSDRQLRDTRTESLNSQHKHRLGKLATRDGLWLWHDLLTSAISLAVTLTDANTHSVTQLLPFYFCL
jgi:hypothetical protein